MAVATQAVISVGAVYVSLGTPTAGMLISPEGEIEIQFVTSQPAATAPGHPLGMSNTPYFTTFPTLQVWAVSATGQPVNVVVTF